MLLVVGGGSGADSAMPEVHIPQKVVFKILSTLDVNKANGPDSIPATVIRS